MGAISVRTPHRSQQPPGLLPVTLLGALQLKNDGKIKDESFTGVVKETYKTFFSLGGGSSREKGTPQKGSKAADGEEEP